MAALVAAAKKDRDDIASLHKVDPIAGAIVDPELAYTFADRGDVAGIASRKPIDALCDAGPARSSRNRLSQSANAAVSLIVSTSRL